MTRFFLLTVLLCVCMDTFAYAKKPICVVLSGERGAEAMAYHRLALSEVRRHRHHYPVKSNCKSTLNLDYIEIDEAIFLVAYFDGSVPARLRLKKNQPIEDGVSRVVASALKSDPVALIHDTPQYLDAILKSDSGLVEGGMLYGVETYQSLVFVNGSLNFLPGFGLRLRRRKANFQVGARATSAFHLGTTTRNDHAKLSVISTLEPDFLWYFSPDSTSSFYAGGSLGLGVIRFDGLDSTGSSDSATDIWLMLGLRVGVEFLRAHEFRFDVFVQGNAPLMPTKSNDGEWVNTYTPWIQLGGGVSF